MNSTNIFFELLQIAIGNRDNFSHELTPKDWNLLYNLCQKQSLIGIGFAGIIRLPIKLRPGMAQFAQWIYDAENIKDKNLHLVEQCKEITDTLLHDGINSCVIKGQSNRPNYPEWLRDYRTAGDIDLWTLPINSVNIKLKHGDSIEQKQCKGIEGIVEYARMYRQQHNQPTIPWHRVLYYHVEVNNDEGTEVEMHYRPSYLNCLWRNHRLQNWFGKNQQFSQELINEGFAIPTNDFNAIYQLLHIYKHLFEEGIGLRQILDYYFVLQNLHKEYNTEKNCEIMKQLSCFGMKKFASAMMYVLQTVFAMPNEYLLCKPNENEGRFLLNEIMMAGNFGKYDKRIARGSKSFMGFKVSTGLVHAWEKSKHNFRLIRHYPEEVMWEPIFRIYHFLWRRFELWKW